MALPIVPACVVRVHIHSKCVCVRVRDSQNKMSTRQSPSRRMGTPTTGRLATIPSATGQAAKQAYDRDDDDDGGVGEQLSPALEHQGDDDGTPRRKSVPHGNKVVPVTLEEVDE